MSSVIVTADQNGRVIVPAGTDFGYIRVQQSTTKFTERGFAVMTTVSALIFAKLDVLRSFGWKDSQEIEGKIVIKESLTPFNTKDPDKDLKVAGKSNIPCTKNGRKIYRRAVYTTDMSAVDTLIAHDNYIPRDFDLIESEEVTPEQVTMQLDFTALPDFGEEN